MAILNPNRAYVDVPMAIDPYLRKYVAGNQHHVDLYPCNDPRSIWMHVVSLLSFPPSGWRPERIPAARLLSLRLPKWYLDENRLCGWMSTAKKKHLARIIEHTYWTDLYFSTLRARLELGMREADAIRQFRDAHGITEIDFSEESTLRRYRRMKKAHGLTAKTRVAVGVAA